MQSLTLLIAAGADPMVADRLGKCCGHYLAEWRFTKERVDVSVNYIYSRYIKWQTVMAVIVVVLSSYLTVMCESVFGSQSHFEQIFTS